MEFLGFLAGFAVIAIIAIVIVSIILYFMSAIALSEMAKNRDIDNPWLAFIPIGNLYIMGCIIEEFTIFKWAVPHAYFVLPALSLIPTLRALGDLAGLISSLAPIVLLFALYELYKGLDPDNATRNIILSIIIPPSSAVILFNLRHN